MKGYWHVIALSVLMAALSVFLDKNLFIFVFIWLLYLFYYNRIKVIALVFALFCFFFYFQHLPQIESESSTIPTMTSNQMYFGKVVSEPVINQKKIEFVMEDSSSTEKIMILYFPNDGELDVSLTSQLNFGANCEVHGLVEQPDEARNPGEFDYREYLLTKDISYQIIVTDLSVIQCVGTSFLQRFFTLRTKLFEQAPNNLSEFTAAWVNALVLGDDSLLDDSVIEVFQNWGLSHLLAISGLHIGIVVAIVYFLLIKLNLLSKEKAELIMLLFLPIYAVLAGSQPSVLRASMMVLLLLITRRIKMNISALDVISIVFLLLLLFDKYMIYHIGFQFSFIVTCGIILSRKWLATVSSPIFQGLIISFVSQMVILPLQLNYFTLIQPLSILLNLIIVPYFSLFVIPFMFLLLISSFLPEIILRFFDMIFVSIHHSVLASIEFIDRHFDYPLLLSNLPIWLIVFYYILLILAHYFLGENRLKQAFLSFFALVFLLIGYASIPYFSPKGYVTMLDIGQGDAFVIELPYRKAVFMIDAGSSFSFEDMEPSKSVYKQIIQPYLRHRGIHRLNAVFLTHEDIDHTGSLGFMIDDDVVDTIYVSAYYSQTNAIFSKAIEDGITIERIEAGDIIDIENQQLTALAPIRDKQDENMNSLVLYTVFGGDSWLFTGDIGKEEERELIKDYRIKADVLKVAHHGSNTSSDQDFIETIEAETALISAGVNNSYGHPTTEVIETLEALGLQILRTDQNGAVQYQFVDNQGSFYIFSP